jgi:hypothetical protein
LLSSDSRTWTDRLKIQTRGELGQPVTRTKLYKSLWRRKTKFLKKRRRWRNERDKLRLFLELRRKKKLLSWLNRGDRRSRKK